MINFQIQKLLFSVCDKVLAEKDGGCGCRNFIKYEFWKVEHFLLSLVKYIRFLGWDITAEKTTFFLLHMFYLLNVISFKKILRKKS